MMRMKLTTTLIILAPLVMFDLGRAQEKSPGRRLTPPEIEAIPSTGGGAGTSGLSGIQTRVLKGDPNKAGLYTIQLTIPANTRIKAHTHPDHRIATSVRERGTSVTVPDSMKKIRKRWLPAVLYRTPNVAHFARTGDRQVVVQITGYGPTGTQYTESGQAK